MEIKGRTLTLALISENKNIFIFFQKSVDKIIRV